MFNQNPMMGRFFARGLPGIMLVCMASLALSVRADEIGKAFRDCPNCPEMIEVPAGSFDMGASDGDADEYPIHRVTIAKSFAIGRTEVTQLQWRAVMQDQSRNIAGNDPSYFSSCGDDCPVEQVSWNDVQTFIQRLSAKTRKQYRLPSEAEWEYACRAGGRQLYCGSDSVDGVAWYGASAEAEGNSGNATAHVASKAPNAFGLYDMSGNVWEWVEDSYHDSYKGAPTDARPWQSDGKRRVLRGGSWFNAPQSLRAASRHKEVPTFRSKFAGFRLVRMLP